MKEYHKINTIFKRSRETNRIIEGDFSTPEFEFLANNVWTWSEKVDGTNIRVMFDGEKITFGGKTDNAQIPAMLWTRLNEVFLPLMETFASVFSSADVCLYGEGYGAKIQKGGGNYRTDQDFVLFDILVSNAGYDWWLQRADVEDVAAKLGIDVVPIIGEGSLHDAISEAKTGIISTWGNFQAEGIVARPKTELKTRNGQRIITKIKCRDFARGESNNIANSK
jgi:ATP-dependent RNA circularization protein (DNA/RNA ligase family)